MASSATQLPNEPHSLVALQMGNTKGRLISIGQSAPTETASKTAPRIGAYKRARSSRCGGTKVALGSRFRGDQERRNRLLGLVIACPPAAHRPPHANRRTPLRASHNHAGLA